MLAVVGVHLEDAADPLLAVLGRVEHGVALAEHARVDAGEGELAEVLVGHDLEGEGGERLLVVGHALELSLPFRSLPGIGGTSRGLGR